jgi:hypothetical protein
VPGAAGRDGPTSFPALAAGSEGCWAGLEDESVTRTR